jgi:hypothetical protein
MTATCAHLRQVESDMRLAGMPMRLASSIAVAAKCRIDPAGLAARYRLRPPAHYAEFYLGDRSAQDFPTACITCSTCRSSISVLHPDEARGDTMWFPHQPSPDVP